MTSLEALKLLMFLKDTECVCEVGIQFSSTYSPKSVLQSGVGLAQSTQRPSCGQDSRAIVFDFRKFIGFPVFRSIQDTKKNFLCKSQSQLFRCG